MKYYGKVGTTSQTVDQSSNPVAPQGYIEMQVPQPSTKYIAQEGGTWEYPLELAKQEHISNILYPAFVKARDSVVWIKKTGSYGFDTAESDRINWQNALTMAQASSSKSTNYMVYLSIQEKAFIEVTVEQLLEAGELSKQQQYNAYIKFTELRQKASGAETQEELEQIVWD